MRGIPGKVGLGVVLGFSSWGLLVPVLWPWAFIVSVHDCRTRLYSGSLVIKWGRGECGDEGDTACWMLTVAGDERI